MLSPLNTQCIPSNSQAIIQKAYTKLEPHVQYYTIETQALCSMLNGSVAFWLYLLRPTKGLKNTVYFNDSVYHAQFQMTVHVFL